MPRHKYVEPHTLLNNKSPMITQVCCILSHLFFFSNLDHAQTQVRQASNKQISEQCLRYIGCGQYQFLGWGSCAWLLLEVGRMALFKPNGSSCQQTSWEKIWFYVVCISISPAYIVLMAYRKSLGIVLAGNVPAKITDTAKEAALKELEGLMMDTDSETKEFLMTLLVLVVCHGIFSWSL